MFFFVDGSNIVDKNVCVGTHQSQFFYLKFLKSSRYADFQRSRIIMKDVAFAKSPQ